MEAQVDEARPVLVAFCIRQIDVGGAERCLVEIATRLDRRKFEPAVYCLGPPPEAPRDALVRQLRAAGMEPRFLGVRRRWRLLASVRRLTHALRERRPQVLQTFLFHANVVGAISARFSGVEHLVGGIRVADPRSRLRLKTERLLTRGAERLVCVSQSVADFSATQGRQPREKLVVIPNGIDMERFRGVVPADLTRLGLPPGRRALCTVGRLDRQKNLEWLLRETPRLLAMLPRHDLLVVGDGPQRARLSRLAKELGTASRVHFAGWQPDIIGILAACDLLLLPSAWEGMPNILLEAMAAGRPVVAAEVEGVRQILGSLAPQQMFPSQNGQLLRERVAAILANPGLAQRLGQDNRSRVEAEFSMKRMVDAYEQLYLSLVRG